MSPKLMTQRNSNLKLLLPSLRKWRWLIKGVVAEKSDRRRLHAGSIVKQSVTWGSMGLICTWDVPSLLSIHQVGFVVCLFILISISRQKRLHEVFTMLCCKCSNLKKTTEVSIMVRGIHQHLSTSSGTCSDSLSPWVSLTDVDIYSDIFLSALGICLHIMNTLWTSVQFWQMEMERTRWLTHLWQIPVSQP